MDIPFTGSRHLYFSRVTFISPYSIGSGGEQVSAQDVSKQAYTITADGGAVITGVTDTIGLSWQIDGSTATAMVDGPNSGTSFDINVAANFPSPGLHEIDLDANQQTTAISGGNSITTTGSSKSSSKGRQIAPPAVPGPQVTPQFIYCINDQNAVDGHGHSAVIIPNGHGCTYFSYSMDGLVTALSFQNIDDALASAKVAGYTREEHWGCTVEQGARAATAAASFNHTPYQVSTHNCWHMVLHALEDAGTNATDGATEPNKSFNDNKHLADGFSDL